jgi:hypothetical protein
MSKLFLSNPDHYYDDSSYFDMRLEQEDMLINEGFNKLKGMRNWKAICLTDYSAQESGQSQFAPGSRVPIRGRPVTAEHFIPMPFDKKLPPNHGKRYNGVHPMAYAARGLGDMDSLPICGQSMEWRWDSNGPALKGQHRGGQFFYSKKVKSASYDCATGMTPIKHLSFGFTNLGQFTQTDAVVKDQKSTNTIQPIGWTGNSGLIMNDKTVGFMNKLRASVPTHISLHVNSMQRSPAAQARAIITKINQGDDLVGLYAQDDLILEALNAVGVTNKVIPNPKFSKTGREHQVLTQVFSAQVARGRYISGHMRGNGIDIRVIDWPKSVRKKYTKVVLDHAKKIGAKKAIYESKPPHVHLGI